MHYDVEESSLKIKSWSGPTTPNNRRWCQQHILRVYLQVQWWKGNKLLPTEWAGNWSMWKKMEEKEILKPVTNTKPLAPNDIFQLASCAYKQECGNYCPVSWACTHQCVSIVIDLVAIIQQLLRMIKKNMSNSWWS